MASKNCNKCNELKPLSEFNKQKANKDGLRSECKCCQKTHRDKYKHTREGVITKIYGQQRSRSRERCHDNPPYNNKQLLEWVLSQDNFEKLYLNWVASGYEKRLIPSCDRLDNYKGYSFDNIRLVTWQENNNKGHFDIKSGINNKLSKTVIQFGLSGEFIAEHHSSQHASRITNITRQNISKCCIGERKTAGGFHWEFATNI